MELCVPLELPERNKTIMLLLGKSDENINKFSKYMTLIRVTARILNLKSNDTLYTEEGIHFANCYALGTCCVILDQNLSK